MYYLVSVSRPRICSLFHVYF